MDEVPPKAEHESIATSLEVEQLDKNLFVIQCICPWFIPSLKFVPNDLDSVPGPSTCH
jgi:hypothetical protein